MLFFFFPSQHTTADHSLKSIDRFHDHQRNRFYQYGTRRIRYHWRTQAQTATKTAVVNQSDSQSTGTSTAIIHPSTTLSAMSFLFEDKSRGSFDWIGRGPAWLLAWCVSPKAILILFFPNVANVCTLQDLIRPAPLIHHYRFRVPLASRFRRCPNRLYHYTWPSPKPVSVRHYSAIPSDLYH